MTNEVITFTDINELSVNTNLNSGENENCYTNVIVSCDEKIANKIAKDLQDNVLHLGLVLENNTNSIFYNSTSKELSISIASEDVDLIVSNDKIVEDVKNMKKELSSLRKDNKKLENDYASLQNEHEENSFEKLESTIKKLENENKELVETGNGLVKENNKLSKTIEGNKETIKKLADHISGLKSKILELSSYKKENAKNNDTNKVEDTEKEVVTTKVENNPSKKDE